MLYVPRLNCAWFVPIYGINCSNSKPNFENKVPSYRTGNRGSNGLSLSRRPDLIYKKSFERDIPDCAEIIGLFFAFCITRLNSNLVASAEFIPHIADSKL